MVKLLKNEPSTENHLDQGWFGLRNRKPKEAHISDQERDQNESDLFEKPEWASVRKSQTGIKVLMDHIDKARRSRIQESMPKIIKEIRGNLINAKKSLKNLVKRATLQLHSDLTQCNSAIIYRRWQIRPYVVVTRISH